VFKWMWQRWQQLPPMLLRTLTLMTEYFPSPSHPWAAQPIHESWDYFGNSLVSEVHSEAACTCYGYDRSEPPNPWLRCPTMESMLRLIRTMQTHHSRNRNIVITHAICQSGIPKSTDSHVLQTHFIIIFCVGPAVTHRMYCSLSRLIVLTPL
jgi:hypothetical protein